MQLPYMGQEFYGSCGHQSAKQLMGHMPLIDSLHQTLSMMVHVSPGLEHGRRLSKQNLVRAQVMPGGMCRYLCLSV